MSSRPTRSALVRVTLAATVAVALSVALATPASAKTATATGDYRVTVGGTTYDPAPGRSVTVKDLTSTVGRITVRGVNNTFVVDTATLGVYDYTLTGAPDPLRMVTTPTVVFASKVPTLTPAQLAGARLKDLEVKDDSLTMLFTTSLGKVKVQAKDGAQGGVFQMETEFAGPVEFVHTLGSSLFYFVNPNTGKVNFGDGTSAVTSGSATHQMLLGKDSPQVATKTFQSGSVTRWTVQPGGRLGGVLGEDAVELSQGATNCTSDCQAQNRIHGSLPVPADPVDPTPIAG